MKRLLKRVRGILGTAATWAVAWVGLGIGIGALVGIDLRFIVPMALNSAVAGFIAGTSFAVILSIAERRSSLEELSFRRVASWGAGGGLVLSFIPLAFGMPLPLLLGPLVINAGIGAGMATGSVALAKRADDRQFVSGADAGLLNLEGD